jgi:hypothetical protein
LISIRADPGDRTGFVSRIAQRHASEGGSAASAADGRYLAGTSLETSSFGRQFVLFREVALVAAQYARH